MNSTSHGLKTVACEFQSDLPTCRQLYIGSNYRLGRGVRHLFTHHPQSQAIMFSSSRRECMDTLPTCRLRTSWREGSGHFLAVVAHSRSASGMHQIRANFADSPASFATSQQQRSRVRTALWSKCHVPSPPANPGDTSVAGHRILHVDSRKKQRTPVACVLCSSAILHAMQ